MQLILMLPDSFPLVMETEKERYSYTVRPSNLILLLLLLMDPSAQGFAVCLPVWLQATYSCFDL